jgi:hypothetical protein
MNNIFYVKPVGQVSLSDLENLFTLVGDVKSIRTEALSLSTVGTRFGVIEMGSEQQAADCIERFNGQEALGLVLSVTASIPVLAPPPVEVRKAAGRRKIGKK